MANDLRNKTAQYLLGMLSEQEQEQLEEEYFAQPERRQELWATFDEMVERFVQREMEVQEAQQFALQLQTKPALRARAERLYTLYHFLSHPLPENHVAKPQLRKASPSFLRTWFVIPAWGWGALVAGALSLAIVGIFLSRQTRKPEHEIAQAQPTVATSPLPSISRAPTPAPSVSRPLLKPDTSVREEQSSSHKTFYILLDDARAQQGATALAIAAQTQTIALYFEVPPPFQSGYQGIAQTSEGVVFKTFPNVKVQPQKGASFLILRIPVAEIPSAEFTVQIKASPVTEAAAPAVSQTFRLKKE